MTGDAGCFFTGFLTSVFFTIAKDLLALHFAFDDVDVDAKLSFNKYSRPKAASKVSALSTLFDDEDMMATDLEQGTSGTNSYTFYAQFISPSPLHLPN